MENQGLLTMMEIFRCTTTTLETSAFYLVFRSCWSLWFLSHDVTQLPSKWTTGPVLSASLQRHLA